MQGQGHNNMSGSGPDQLNKSSAINVCYIVPLALPCCAVKSTVVCCAVLSETLNPAHLELSIHNECIRHPAGLSTLTTIGTAATPRLLTHKHTQHTAHVQQRQAHRELLRITRSNPPKAQLCTAQQAHHRTSTNSLFLSRGREVQLSAVPCQQILNASRVPCMSGAPPPPITQTPFVTDMNAAQGRRMLIPSYHQPTRLPAWCHFRV